MVSLFLVRRFLRWSQASSQLEVSILRQVTNRPFSVRQLMQVDVPAWALLSKSMQMELAFALNRPHLLKRTHRFSQFKVLIHQASNPICGQVLGLGPMTAAFKACHPRTPLSLHRARAWTTNCGK